MFVMVLVVFIDILGFGIIIPLLPFYGVHFAPDHPFLITMLMATYSGFQLISAPVWGRLSDRIGRRPVVLVSLITSIIGYLWLSQATSLWMLFATRAVQGISAGNISVAQAYVADVTAPERRARGMGLLGAAIGIGFTLGPAIGGWLAGPDPNHVSSTLPAVAAAGFSGLALVLALFALKESRPAGAQLGGAPSSRWQQIRDAFAHSTLRRLLLVYFTTTLAFAGMETTFAQWALTRLAWGPQQVGEMFGSIGVLAIILQGGLIGRLAERFGEPRLIAVGTVLTGSGLAVLAFAHGPGGAILGCCGVAIGQGLTSPAISSLVSRDADAKALGGTLGVNQSMGALARLVGPALAGAAFEWEGPGAAYALGSLIMVIGFLLAMHVRRAGAEVAEPAFQPVATEPLAGTRRIG
jgi:DHA1 family tetracycline resistance protein-like MFS transporter